MTTLIAPIVMVKRSLVSVLAAGRRQILNAHNNLRARRLERLENANIRTQELYKSIVLHIPKQTLVLSQCRERKPLVLYCCPNPAHAQCYNPTARSPSAVAITNVLTLPPRIQIQKLKADAALGMDHNLLLRIPSDVFVNVNGETPQFDGVEREKRAAGEARAVGRI